MISDGPVLIRKILNQLFCSHGRDVWEFSFTFSTDVLRKLTKSLFFAFQVLFFVEDDLTPRTKS